MPSPWVQRALAEARETGHRSVQRNDHTLGDFVAADKAQRLDLIRRARAGEQWAQASCERLGIDWRSQKGAA